MMDNSFEEERKSLRARHQLRTLTQEEDGQGIDHLPGGVYGFTYSPAEDNFPLFEKQELRSFEAHKLSDGSSHLVGFVDQGDSLKMETGRESVTVHLFAEPREEASCLVTIPLVRLLKHEEHSQRKGKGLELEVGPAPRG